MSEQLLAQLNSLIAKDVEGYHLPLRELSSRNERQLSEQGINDYTLSFLLCWHMPDANKNEGDICVFSYPTLRGMRQMVLSHWLWSISPITRQIL
jgi:hypothetical protein